MSLVSLLCIYSSIFMYFLRYEFHACINYSRLAQRTIRINGKYHLNIIQAYLPTSSHEDQKVESVYEDIDNLITNSKTTHIVIMGEFNAKFGLGDPAKSCIGPYGLGSRNTRGDSLVNFSESHKLNIMNTFFKKRLHRRWTWISPNENSRSVHVASPPMFQYLQFYYHLHTNRRRYFQESETPVRVTLKGPFQGLL